MRGVLYSLIFILLATVDVWTQEAEWLFKVPRYYRLKGGSSVMLVDKMSGAIMFDGGAYDTYVTYDGGATWKTIFDIKMFFIDVATEWQMDEVGRWYYIGNVYGKQPINLVTEDAGETMRYVIRDTNALPFLGRWEERPKVVQPNAILIDASNPRYPRPGVPLGTYTSCDAGRTWSFHGFNRYRSSSADERTVGSGRFVMSDSNFKAREVIACTDSVIETKISTSWAYVRFKDGTVVQYVPQVAGFVRGFHITNPVDSSVKLVNPVFSIVFGGLVNDTCALYFGNRGQIVLYGMKSGLRIIDEPQVYSRFQAVGNAGIYGDRVLMQTIIPNGNLREGTRWIIYNTRTGSVSKHTRPPSYGTSWGIYYQTNPFDISNVVPVSDSTWLASFRNGELLKTKNAGATWEMVGNITRDERWGESWIGINRLFLRGDGKMALLNDRNRLITGVPGTDSWQIIHPAPFIHEINMGPNVTESFTRSSFTYRDDYNHKFRTAYGPSTIHFEHPDTLWLSGDVVGRYTTDGKFIDTILPRRSRLLKRISPLIAISAMDSLYFTFNQGKHWIYVGYTLPKFAFGKDSLVSRIGDATVAGDGSIIVGLRGMRTYRLDDSLIDTIPGGIMRSTNEGNTWERCTADIPEWLYITSLITTPSGTLFCLGSDLNIDPRVVDERTGERYLIDNARYNEKNFKLGLSYIYRSTDNGLTWTRTFVFPDRNVLPATDMRFTFMPDGRIMAIHATGGIAISRNDGITWGLGDPLNIGNPLVNDVVFTDDGYSHLATSHGYVRIRTENILKVRELHPEIGSLRAYLREDGTITFPTDLPTLVTLYSLDGRLIQRIEDTAGISNFQCENQGHRVVVVVAQLDGQTLSTLLVR